MRIIIIVILGFVALWLTMGVTEYNGTVSGLDGSSRIAAGRIAGSVPWAPALINAEAVAAGSPCRVPYDWIPTPNSPQPPCITEPPLEPLRSGAPLGPEPPRRSRQQNHPVQEKMSH